MVDREELSALFEKHGYSDFKWMKPIDVIVAQWVRMKCLFGCPESGRNACCPPNVPSIKECRQFFDEYSSGVIFHFEKAVDRPEDRHAWTKGVNLGLLKLERTVFLLGYQKAFLLFIDSCTLCEECVGARGECKQPRLARPTPESMGVDVYATARHHGYPIEVLKDYDQSMNRYALLLIE